MFISDSLAVNNEGHLTIGGADVVSLAKKYGTPLYIMDEDKIRRTCKEYQNAMTEAFGNNFTVNFASKAFSTKAIYKIIDGEGLSADVVSGGELFTALSANFPSKKISFHGNNKTRDEIVFALKSDIKQFIVDNSEELKIINDEAGKLSKIADISFRIKPGVDAHTHDFVKTGQIDSKFGVALENGEALEIIKTALSMENIRLVGLHCHIGSQIFDSEPFSHAAKVMLEFIAKIKSEFGFEIRELDLGGGFGVKYVNDDDPKAISEAVRSFAETVKNECEKLGISLPHISIEPGRSIVADAGITVYTVGSVKKIEGIRTYVAVDGGMTDNPRYALYGSEYTMLLPERPLAEKAETYTVAGRNCESGDLLGENISLPEVNAGDLLCVLTTGAYNYSMASNYNRVPRPPVIMVNGEEDRLVVKRETYEDLISNDLL